MLIYPNFEEYFCLLKKFWLIVEQYYYFLEEYFLLIYPSCFIWAFCSGFCHCNTFSCFIVVLKSASLHSGGPPAQMQYWKALHTDTKLYINPNTNTKLHILQKCASQPSGCAKRFARVRPHISQQTKQVENRIKVLDFKKQTKQLKTELNTWSLRNQTANKRGGKRN